MLMRIVVTRAQLPEDVGRWWKVVDVISGDLDTELFLEIQAYDDARVQRIVPSGDVVSISRKTFYLAGLAKFPEGHFDHLRKW